MGEKILGLELSADCLTAVLIKKSFKSCTVIDICWIPHPGRDGSEIVDNLVDGGATQPYNYLNGSGASQPPAKKGGNRNLAKVHNGSSGWQWDAESFDRALTTLLSKMDLKGCSFSALCLPAALVSFRTLKVPFASEAKIRQILPFELSSHLPMGNSEYLSDFIPVDSSDIFATDKMDNLSLSDEKHIFTCSLAVDVMDICFSVMKKHGIAPELVTSQGVVAATCLKDALFIETTDSDTVISVLVKKNVMAVRSFAGKKDAVFIEKAIQQTLAGLCQRYGVEISPTCCYTLSDDNCLDKMDVSNLLGIKPVTISDYINIGTSVDLSDEIHGSGFNAIAAALLCARRQKTINFCQGLYAKDSFFHKFRAQLVLLAIFASITAVALFMNIEYDIYLLQREVIRFDKEITHSFKRVFPDVKVIVEPLMQMQVKVRDAEKQSGFVPGESIGATPVNIRAIDILYELSSRIPKSVDIDVTRFLISEGRVVMAGSTDNFNSVDKIKTLIEKYNRFKSVTISSATADKNGNRVAFNFLIELR